MWPQTTTPSNGVKILTFDIRTNKIKNSKRWNFNKLILKGKVGECNEHAW